MILRKALKESSWECFGTDQNEEWNTDDVLNSIPAGQSRWLDSECTVSKDGLTIIDIDGDELVEVN